MSNRRTSPPGAFARSASRNRGDKSAAPASTPERILTSAELLFARHGFEGVTMPMVAAASGIAAGAIYKHFDSKSDLFFKVVQRVVQSVPIPTAESESDPTLLPRIVAAYTTQKTQTASPARDRDALCICQTSESAPIVEAVAGR